MVGVEPNGTERNPGQNHKPANQIAGNPSLLRGWTIDNANCFDVQVISLDGDTWRLMFVRSVMQVVLSRPRDLLPCIFPYINCTCAVLCLIRYPMYFNFLILIIK